MKNTIKKYVLGFIASGIFYINTSASLPANGDRIIIKKASDENFCLTLNEAGEYGEGRNWYVWSSTDNDNVYAQLKNVIKDEKTYFIAEGGDGKNVRVVPPPIWPAWVGVADSREFGKNEQFLLKEVKPGFFKLYSFATESWLLETTPGRARFHSPIQGGSGWKRSTEDEGMLLRVVSLTQAQKAAAKAAEKETTEEAEKAAKVVEKKEVEKTKTVSPEKAKPAVKVLEKEELDKKIEIKKEIKKPTEKAVSQMEKSVGKKAIKKKTTGVKKPGKKAMVKKSRAEFVPVSKKATIKAKEESAKLGGKEEPRGIIAKKAVEKSKYAKEVAAKKTAAKKTTIVTKPVKKRMIIKSRAEMFSGQQAEKIKRVPVKDIEDGEEEEGVEEDSGESDE